ncbi:V-type ATP synthase subunit I [Clostridium perfringens]|jgi:V/A-type H+-transporting ATPase subunit I|uniref:V-type ATP synthase subunit I n=1 Tax=Clostridium perfringens TaxID=1502 RepID=A0A6G4ZAE1_CLOPF|nr:V-type ATP synthase subunit I [Clostridium perfringens]EIF6288913.1 V-type ATP synthase subunit I [Clostridium perfringens]EJT5930006.1 V-type ATP synthase subunit I [Clostridium perfringens]EJT6161270.1 V-type ATP synthase subunit I [Clostridium perfringens]EJT6476911.1 V-type ATP synthase subunit I [Clostridium perfringens]EJT6503751.1 V-type ATP synthase subunit I [Clostridium perfringens]
MAIVKMNKFTLLAFESEKEKLLKKIQSSSEVEFINLQDEEKVEGNEVFESLSKDDLDAETTLIEENVSKTRSALDFLKEFVAEVGGLKALKAGKESLTLDELEVKVENSNWEVVYSEVKKMERELATLENEKTKLLGEIEILEPWQSFDAPLGELNNFKKVVAFLGVISSQNLENMKNEIESEFKESYIEVISNTDQDSYVFVMTMKERAEEMDEVLKNFGFSAFQTKYKEKASVLVEEFKLKIQEIEAQKSDLKGVLSNYREEKRTLELAYEYYSNILLRKEASENFLKTDRVVVIQGWVPKNDNSSLEGIIQSSVGDMYYLEFEEVKEEEVAEVPVKLHNKGPAAAFDSITEMYSLPRYDEIDPTPLLTPFYLVFFGMMVADLGYGLVLFVGSLLAMKLLNLDEAQEKFAKFFMYLSIATTIAGAVFGTAFGFELKSIGLINPSKDTNLLLILSVGFGVIQIFFGLFIKAYMLIRDKQYLYALFDVGSWIMLLIGLPMIFFDGPISLVGKVLAIVGSILIILTQGRDEETKGAQIGQGLYALYGITGYVGDLVSYTRLMALGIAGGSIAAALNLIIGMFPGIAVIIVGPLFFIAAHTFNMLLSLLGAYVHTARLQYVEYFSKFYEGGGKAFTPFRTINKFITIKRNK